MHITDQALLNIKILVIMIFFVVLALGGRKRWLDARELTASGIVLVIAAAITLYDSALRAAIGAYGRKPSAFGIAAALVVPFVVMLAFALRIIVKRVKQEPQTAKPDGGKKRTQPKGSKSTPQKKVTPDTESGPKPKPQRKAPRRRF